MKPLWRIDEFAQVVQQALEAGDYPGPRSARVRPVPDRRTIRYYTTLGLLDRPAQMRGRVAYYGPRHVLQLAAIKQLQARGATLRQVQQELAGADEEHLRRWARIPEEFWKQWSLPPEAASEEKPSAPASPSRGRPFWRQVPELPQEPLPAELPSPYPVQPAASIRLAPGATLVLEGVGPQQLDPRTLWSLRSELERLREKLAALGLVPPEKPDASRTSKQEAPGRGTPGLGGELGTVRSREEPNA